MNAYQTAKKYELTGTDAEIVAIIRKLTIKNVSLAGLRQYLRDNEMLFQTRTGWDGTLAAVNNPSIDKLIDALGDPRQQTISTTEPRWAVPFHDTVVGLLAGGVLTQQQADAVMALGGGYQFADLTVEDYTEQKEAGQLLDEKRAIVEEARNAEIELAKPHNQAAQEIQALDLSAYTVDELQTEINAIRAAAGVA